MDPMNGDLPPPLVLGNKVHKETHDGCRALFGIGRGKEHHYQKMNVLESIAFSFQIIKSYLESLRKLLEFFL